MSAGGGWGRKTAAPPAPRARPAALVEPRAPAAQPAHERGVAPRDLNPANVLLPEDGQPKVTDFGLAKQPAQDLPATGAVLGTPSYMAPEQAAGDSRSVGPAAD